MKTNHHKKDALDIFNKALESADPYKLVGYYTGKVRTEYHRYGAERLIVIGFGKAAAAMGKAAEDSLLDIIDEGILITKHGHSNKTGALKKLKLLEAGHPVPDEYGYAGAGEVVRLLQEADEHTLVLCLISGGGSALLVYPYGSITLNEKQHASELLLRSGADITELNTVRKHISRVKGGRLAEIARPANVISLILSDVIGDSLDVIASGPTAPDKTTYSDALKVLDKYGLTDKVPENIMRVIGQGNTGLIPETPKDENPLFSGVENIIVGSNRIALQAAKQQAEIKGFYVKILSSEILGEAREVGKWLARKAVELMQSDEVKPLCLISGGETTVTVTDNGTGGRNMEFALSFAVEIEGIEGITFLSAGTDGTDGPTDAAGAIVDGKTIEKARREGLDPQAYLNNNDSYNFFRKIGGLLITGPTGTNVMDIQVVVIDPCL